MNAAPRRSIRLGVAGDVLEIEPDEMDMPEMWDVEPLSARRFAVGVGGETWLVDVPDYEAEAEAIVGGDRVTAPMPGKLIDLKVAAGDEVKKDQVVAVMEAMKMEHSLKAPRDGSIKATGASVGDQVAEGAMLVELDEV